MTETLPSAAAARSTTVTPAAQQFIRRMVRLGGLGQNAGFRLVVTLGGCSGINAEFTIEAGPKAGDSVLEVDGGRLFLPAASRELLDGVTIDFADTLMQTGLTFVNAKTKAACATTSGPTLVKLTPLSS